ncbi:LysM peptidoglycan-binding domain-containing protein [Aureimonas phyllosphaerae]|nr:LysM peptidoglycan-binding domain-containing protein [Aureimonas phyllosphaerae]MBB3959118.1 nucleoid-associated protein YgaU [Aureimonas phyllosphaerae]
MCDAMIRRKGPILAVAVIAAFALGWYRGLFGVDTGTSVTAPHPAIPTGTTSSSPAPSQIAADDAPVPSTGQTSQRNASESGEQTASQTPAAGSEPPGTTASSQSPETASASSPAPGFDVVRVEPDGSTVVAGKGAANELITLTDGTRTFGQANTDANGDFVMTLSLPEGSHRLQLAQRDDNVSNDAAVINVPPSGKSEELLVMMQRPGEASEIIQRPAEAGLAAALPSGPNSAAEESRDDPEPPRAVAAVAPQPATPNVPTPSEATGTLLGVDAVEIEGDRLFVAGSVKERSTVRVYLDDQPVAEARSGVGERYVASARTNVAVGQHTIRVDALDEAGRVVSRVEVPFQRPDGNSMAAIAAAPKPRREQENTTGTASKADAADGPRSAGTAASVGAPGDAASADAASASSAPDAAEIEPAAGSSTTAAGTAAGSMASAEQRPDGAAGSDGMSASGSAPATEPPTVRQAPLEASASRVIIRRGDTLWRISRETYGRGNRYTVIYLANGDQIRDPNRIYPGQVFRVPDDAIVGEPPRG